MTRTVETVIHRNQERDRVLKKVKQIIIERLNLDLSIEEIDDDSPLFGMGLGLDSIDSLELVVGVEDEFEVQIMDEDIEAFLSVNALVDFILHNGAPPAMEPYRSSPDADAQPWIAQYVKLREEAFFYETRCRLIELPEGDDTMALISRVVTGRDILLEPNRMLHSAILDDHGRILDFIYVLMFENKFWLVMGPDAIEAQAFLASEAEKAGIAMSVMDDQYSFLSLEGPYSWKAIKAVAGFEITGLTYLSFMEPVLADETYVLCRAGVTNEYGFRMIVPRRNHHKLIEAIEAHAEFGIRLNRDQALIKQVLTCASTEVRFPLLDVSVPKLANPVEYELRWMIDFRKTDYPGKRAIDHMIPNFDFKVIGFVVSEYMSDADYSSLTDGGLVYLEDQCIGKVLNLQKSIGIDQYIGYALLEKAWAYVGNQEYSLGKGGAEISLRTIATPMLVTKSMGIIME